MGNASNLVMDPVSGLIPSSSAGQQKIPNKLSIFFKEYLKWKKGLRHGKGTFTHASGKIEEGIWKKGKFVK